MAQTLAPDLSGHTASKGLLARALGIITSPRATYADVAARPRVLGALLAVLLTIGAPTFAFLSTEVGRNAVLDQQLDALDAFGFNPSEEQLQRMEAGANRSAYFAVAGQAVVVPLASLVVAGLALAVFNAGMGGNATFKQVYALVVHSWFLPALQTLFVMPLNYAKESMSSATSLAVFLPMLDDRSFAGRLLGSIDLFRIWWIVSLAIGFGVLYRRKTTPIAVAMLVVYGIVAVTIAAAMTAFSGA